MSISGDHAFRYEIRNQVDPMSGYAESIHGMWCTKCGQQMNKASPICPGRQSDANLAIDAHEVISKATMALLVVFAAVVALWDLILR